MHILDEAFEGIEKAKANAEKNLQNAKALFESYLDGVFSQRGEGVGGEITQASSASLEGASSRHRPRNEKKLFGGKYPKLSQTGDIGNTDQGGNHALLSKAYNDPEGLEQSKICGLKEGDLYYYRSQLNRI